jgi:outer membrane protein TolC
MNTLVTARIDTLSSLLESYHQLRRLQDQLRTLRLRLDDARRYLNTAGSNEHLGQAQLDRVRARYSATLAGLRLARREAHRRLGLTAPADHQHVA